MTLATLYIIRGIDILVVGGGQVVASSLPNSFLNIPQATILGIPDLAIVIAVGRCGRRLLPALVPLGPRALRDRLEPRRGAAGRDPDRPRASSRRSSISGALAGIAGVLWAARFGTIDSTAGTRLRAAGRSRRSSSAAWRSSAAAGRVVGAALGALLLNTINSALYVLGISSFWDQAIAGLLLIARDRARPCDHAAADSGPAPEVAPWSLRCQTPDVAAPAAGRHARLLPLVRWESGLALAAIGSWCSASSRRRSS